MDISTRKRLRDWIHRMVYVESQDRGDCVRFGIRHVNAAGVARTEIGNIIIAGRTVSPDEIPGWINEIDVMTVNDATGIGGMNRYQVQSYFQLKEDDPEKKPDIATGPRLIIRVDGGSEEGDGQEETGDAQSTEAPTVKGLMTQLMRHNEVLFKMATASTMQVMGVMQRENARLAEGNERYTEKQVELITTVESLHTQRHERELASATALIKQDAIREGLNKFMHLLPMMVNGFAKKRGVLPEKTTPIEQMVHSIVSTLTPKQFEGLLSVLNPEQQASLLNVAQSMFQFEVKDNSNGEKKDGTERANQSLVKA